MCLHISILSPHSITVGEKPRLKNIKHFAQDNRLAISMSTHEYKLQQFDARIAVNKDTTLLLKRDLGQCLVIVESGGNRFLELQF